jgi:ubiquinone/menaquinone biosynthesis C-methylase UbiE
MSTKDPETLRAEMLDRWDRGAEGWRQRADDIRDFGRPVSDWIIEELDLRPGQRILELAAGPGDTGFLAAQRIAPGGTLICSDGSEAMLKIARDRASALGLDNVEFVQLQLEWIDLETASVHAALCRWALMLLVDPGAALQEIRRVLRPEGRFATAVWDAAEHNPWATIPMRALIELGHMERPDPEAPGMFTLADPGALKELMESAGFVEIRLDTLKIERPQVGLDEYLSEQLDLSLGFKETRQRLDDQQWDEVRERITELAEQYTAPDGSITFPARCRLASAST